MSKINSFDVLKEMSEANMKIALATTLVGVRKEKAGGVISIGCSEEWLHNVIVLKYPVRLLIFDPEQFKQIQEKLEANQNSSENRNTFNREDMVEFANWYEEHSHLISGDQALTMFLDSIDSLRQQ